MNVFAIFLYTLSTTASFHLYSSQASKTELAQLKNASLAYKSKQKNVWVKKQPTSQNIDTASEQIINTLATRSSLETKESVADKIAMDTAIQTNATQTTQSSVSNASSIFNEDTQLVPTDPKELQALAEKYKGGITVKGIHGIPKVNLTMKSLKHVFGVKIAKGPDKSQAAYLQGFHHDYNLLTRKQAPPFYFLAHGVGNGIREGFIAFNQTDKPVYKTFFSAILPKEQVINLLIESLRNIQKQEPQQQGLLLIEGITENGITIRTIIHKATGNIVTFFPVTQTSRKEIDAEAYELEQLFERFFRNVANKPQRTPACEREITQLLEQFPQGIPFNMGVGKIDLMSPDMYAYFTSFMPNQYPSEVAKSFPLGLRKSLANMKVYPAPILVDALFKEDRIPTFLKRYPERIEIKNIIKNVYFTKKNLLNTFSEKNDSRFPLYLTRIEILKHVKEALGNIEQGGLRNRFGINNMRSKWELERLPTFSERGDNLLIRGTTKGTDNNDSFTYLIFLNKTTGVIEDFYPLFM